MSAVLGHDVNGEPLRAGDLVVFVGKDSEILISRQKFGDGVFTVLGPPKAWAVALFKSEMVQLEGEDAIHATTDCLRKVKGQSKWKLRDVERLAPSGKSFDQLMADISAPQKSPIEQGKS